jgi:hypothetical protein
MDNPGGIHRYFFKLYKQLQEGLARDYNESQIVIDCRGQGPDQYESLDYMLLVWVAIVRNGGSINVSRHHFLFICYYFQGLCQDMRTQNPGLPGFCVLQAKPPALAGVYV